jgi:lipopolysaccharide biosynthesis glycosyltransferase
MSTSPLHPAVAAPTDADRGKRITVVCCADDTYAMQLAVTARSAIENLRGSHSTLHLYVVDGGIKPHSRQMLLDSVRSPRCVTQILEAPRCLVGDDIDAISRSLGPNGRTISKYISTAAFFRMLIPDLLPREIDKAIYLDCDLVVRGDLEQLWDTNMGDHCVLAAQDTWINVVSDANGLLNYRELGLPSDAKYFNSGVLVLDLDAWREGGICRQAMDYLRSHQAFVRWHDQDVLNPILAGKWGQLDPRWNVNATSFYDFSKRRYRDWAQSGSLFPQNVYESMIRDPFIIHYVSHIKPWTSWSTPREEEFWKYVDMTAWSGWRLTLARRLQGEVARRWKSIRNQQPNRQ